MTDKKGAGGPKVNFLMIIFDMLASCMGSLILYRQLRKFLKGLIMKRCIL